MVWSVHIFRPLSDTHLLPREHDRKAIEERTSEKNMNVTLRRTLLVCVLALALATMWAPTASAAHSP